MSTSYENLHCRPLEGHDPLSPDQIQNNLTKLPHWTFDGEFIEREFAFKNYELTIGFVNALAWMCNQQDHHPELLVRWGRCLVRFNTHSVGGISVNDFICAARANRLYEDAPTS